jgi:predicted TPR repeat methyltransferase
VGPADRPGQAGEALNNLSMLARRAARWNEAEAASRRAVELRPAHGDAWYNLSLALMGQGRVREGLVANSRAVALMPRQSLPRSQVVRALTLLGERAQAAELYRQWLAEEPDNAIVRHLLAACVGSDVPARASDAYVSDVFDAYAASFDASLEKLQYRAPQLVADALHRLIAGAPARALRIVDAGCGTGLCGPLLRPWAAYLAGCDLSVGMLRQARPRACYDALHRAELMHYLRTQPASFDVVVSADTLCYFGDLDEPLSAARTALRPGGALVFTVEDSGGADGFELRTSGRYAHAAEHLRARLGGCGFDCVELSAIVPRQEGGVDVAGWLVGATLAPQR